MAQSDDYDAIVLDLMLPKLDGLTVLERLRQQGHQTHVLILTAKDTVDDRVRGLQTGADDYLVKPFALEELLARVQALIRRGHSQKNPRIRIGRLEVDTSARTATAAGEPVNLTPREYALLEYLARRRGEVLSRTEIERHIYDDAADVMSNVVDSAICALRRKIDLPGRPSLIQTRRGMGYVLQAGEP
jgi:DNA-binding response OmpR family regulator